MKFYPLFTSRAAVRASSVYKAERVRPELRVSSVASRNYISYKMIREIILKIKMSKPRKLNTKDMEINKNLNHLIKVLIKH